MTSSPRGFTLVELLFVVAIISLLTSIGLANMSVARAKTIDTAKRADLASMRTAIRAFHLDKGRVPHNYTCTGACVINDARSTLAIEDTANPDNPTTESGKAFRASMLELVDGGYLTKVPKSPGGAGYVYYDYGPGSSAGAVVGTDLAEGEESETGETGSCRPFPIAQSDAAPRTLLLAAPILEWEACWYLEGEFLVERRCEEGDGVGGDSVGDGANFCSAESSSNYCLCNKY